MLYFNTNVGATLTPWIQSKPNGGGVYLFKLKWDEYSTFNWSR